MKHLRGHGANFDAVPPWEYPIHSVERNAEYTDLAVCMNPSHISAIMEKCLVTAVGWPVVHNGLMLLWEMGIHRQINANVANMDDFIVPEKFARELGMVLATNLTVITASSGVWSPRIQPVGGRQLVGCSKISFGPA